MLGKDSQHAIIWERAGIKLLLSLGGSVLPASREKTRRTNCVGGWLGPRTSLDVVVAQKRE